MRNPTMSTNTVAMRTESWRSVLFSMRGLSGSAARAKGPGARRGPGEERQKRGRGLRPFASCRVAPAPDEEDRGAPRGEQHAVGRGEPEVLEAQGGEDLDRDRPVVVGVEDDRHHEVAERGQEREPGSRGER